MLEIPKVVQQHARRAAKRLSLNAQTEFMAVEGRFVRKGVDLEYRSKDFTFQFVIDNVSATGAALIVPKNVSINTLESFKEIELTFKLLPGYNVKKLAKVIDFRSSKSVGSNEFKVLRVHYKEPATGNFMRWIQFVESLEVE